MPPEKHSYGPHRSQYAELGLPPGEGPHPVVVLLHGGGWQDHYGRQLMWPLAEDLPRHGWAAWNVEYRRVGDAGGYPETLEDVATAIDALAERPEPLDLRAVIALGYSSGGQLALWAAARPRLPADAPGAGPRVAVTAAIAQAGAVDLHRLHALGKPIVPAFLGGTPAEVPERYAQASPAELLPLGVPVLLVHGDEDGMVPQAISQEFAAQAREAGDTCEVHIARGEDHTAPLDPGSGSWATILDWLEDQRP